MLEWEINQIVREIEEVAICKVCQNLGGKDI
jgi:hypothetical protein